MDISALISIVKTHDIDTIHPGYGFLSESAEFAQRMWDEAGAVVIGPGAEILARTGDKLLAKGLARECNVPVLESVEAKSHGQIEEFVQRVGYPVMVKAVDGGGGRGIRLVEGKEGLKTAVDRARGESPSGQIFMEKAAVGGFHHVEVQVIGDGQGEARHLWERDCSVQRRYQKIVEVAPALMGDRKLVAKVIEAALKMARTVGFSPIEMELSDNANRSGICPSGHSSSWLTSRNPNSISSRSIHGFRSNTLSPSA
jgi:pyruvate carboxylase